MTSFDQLVNGFAIALSWQGLLYCFIGCLWGTIVGVLPGLGPLAGMTLLLPLTFHQPPEIGIIMLTGHLLRGSRQAALAAGVDAFLTKPCLPEDLLSAIETVLRRPNAGADATSA